MGRPREHDAATAEALLDAAEHQLRSGGLDGVSLRSIADEAGVSVRAIYSLFGHKDGLVDALAVRTFGRLRDRVERVERTDDPVADLVAAGVEFLRLAVESPESYRLAWERVFTSRPDGDAAWAADGWSARQALRSHIDRVVGDGGDSPAEVQQLTAAFHAVCQGFASCEVNQVFRGMRVANSEELLAATLRSWIDAELRVRAGGGTT